MNARESTRANGVLLDDARTDRAACVDSTSLREQSLDDLNWLDSLTVRGGIGRMRRKVREATGTRYTLLLGPGRRPFDSDHTGSSLQSNLNRWYDPSVGRWLSEDPIEFEGVDANVYRYVGNAPIQATDPTGLAQIKFNGMTPMSVSGSIDPTHKANSYGSSWTFYAQIGDLAMFAQRVTIEGNLMVRECGSGAAAASGELKAGTHSVAWTERYVEIWRIGVKGQTTDTHHAGPRQPASYLEERGGWHFVAKDANLTIIDKNNKRREVEEWRFTMKAKWELVNGFYPNAPRGAVLQVARRFQDYAACH